MPGVGGKSSNGAPGKYSGSQYLIPLVGGSGGGGAYCGSDYPNQPYSSGGGAGGGALLIASSTTINITGLINAVGGNDVGYCANPGAGGGGAIRLMANTINFPSGQISVGGGSTAGAPQGGSGYVRFEAFTRNLGGGIYGNYLTANPSSLALPATGPSAAGVVSVGGIAVNGNPFQFPSFSINMSSAVPVVIHARNIPVGAVPTLYILSETGPDQIVTAPALAGTLGSSTSTVSIKYPAGGSRGLVRVTW